jgi:hypothetical protein
MTHMYMYVCMCVCVCVYQYAYMYMVCLNILELMGDNSCAQVSLGVCVYINMPMCTFKCFSR